MSVKIESIFADELARIQSLPCAHSKRSKTSPASHVEADLTYEGPYKWDAVQTRLNNLDAFNALQKCIPIELKSNFEYIKILKHNEDHYMVAPNFGKAPTIEMIEDKNTKACGEYKLIKEKTHIIRVKDAESTKTSQLAYLDSDKIKQSIVQHAFHLYLLGIPCNTANILIVDKSRLLGEQTIVNTTLEGFRSIKDIYEIDGEPKDVTCADILFPTSRDNTASKAQKQLYEKFFQFITYPEVDGKLKTSLETAKVNITDLALRMDKFKTYFEDEFSIDLNTDDTSSNSSIEHSLIPSDPKLLNIKSMITFTTMNGLNFNDIKYTLKKFIESGNQDFKRLVLEVDLVRTLEIHPTSDFATKLAEKLQVTPEALSKNAKALRTSLLNTLSHIAVEYINVAQPTAVVELASLFKKFDTYRNKPASRKILFDILNLISQADKSAVLNDYLMLFMMVPLPFTRAALNQIHEMSLKDSSSDLIDAVKDLSFDETEFKDMNDEILEGKLNDAILNKFTATAFHIAFELKHRDAKIANKIIWNSITKNASEVHLKNATDALHYLFREIKNKSNLTFMYTALLYVCERTELDFKTPVEYEHAETADVNALYEDALTSENHVASVTLTSPPEVKEQKKASEKRDMLISTDTINVANESATLYCDDLRQFNLTFRTNIRENYKA